MPIAKKKLKSKDINRPTEDDAVAIVEAEAKALCVDLRRLQQMYASSPPRIYRIYVDKLVLNERASPLFWADFGQIGEEGDEVDTL